MCSCYVCRLLFSVLYIYNKFLQVVKTLSFHSVIYHESVLIDKDTELVHVFIFINVCCTGSIISLHVEYLAKLM